MLKLSEIFTKREYYPQVPNELDLRNRLPRKNIENLEVLNVGAGSGHSGLARQLPYLKFKRLDHVDVHKPYLDAAKTRVWETKEINFINASIVNFDTSIYDFVLMFDVLEHLKKEDSLKVLENIKCKQLIFIPLETEFRENTFEAESQDHLSFWTEEDFKSRGYNTEVLKNFHCENGKYFDALWATK